VVRGLRWYAICTPGRAADHLGPADPEIDERQVRVPAGPGPRPARQAPRAVADRRQLAPIRQLIERVNDTLEGRRDLELRGGRSLTGVATRVAQRLLGLTAAMWHSGSTGQPVTRSRAYDH